MMKFIYNLLLPVGVLFFLPGLIWKYRNRGGWKSTFRERFAQFSPERIEELKAFHGAIWIHAVSVGETVVAISLLKEYNRLHPERKFILSTTTTTGQELARKQPLPNTAVIFCPLDFRWMVRKTLNILKPSMLVIFETEIWPNLIWESRKRNIPAVLVNARMSDHSVKGYSKARIFFGPLLEKFNLISAQSEGDAIRFKTVSPNANAVVTGNLKFDQKLPENLPPAEFKKYFGAGEHVVLLAASTHPGEEELIVETYRKLQTDYPQLKLVLVPRHAERGSDLSTMLTSQAISFARRSRMAAAEPPVDVLLADTTGEMLRLMSGADIVIMGKSLAGHDEGHNLIEPALLNKPIVTGHILRNFRFILNVLLQGNAVVAVTGDAELQPQLSKLIADARLRQELGQRAGDIIRQHAGATDRTVAYLEDLLK